MLKLDTRRQEDFGAMQASSSDSVVDVSDWFLEKDLDGSADTQPLNWKDRTLTNSIPKQLFPSLLEAKFSHNSIN